MSLQGLMFTALLVVVLDRPANETGVARLIAELPPLLILLLGGWLGDRTDQRRTLGLMHLLMALPPLLILVVYLQGAISYSWVVIFSALMASIQALSDPTRQSVLSRVSALDIQRSVTLMTVATSLVGLAGFLIGRQLDDWGLATILTIQALLFLAGGLAIARLPALPAPERPASVGGTRFAALGEGFRATWRLPMIRHILLLNFLSSLFNAGAYIIALPYIITDVYGGSTATLGTAMIVFTAGSITSNVVLFRLMPLARPGRLFLLMQLTRVLILLALWTQPAEPVFYALLVVWGLNMGVTTTMVRTTVQELAPAVSRSQILSVLLLSFMVSSPISSLLLGYLIAGADPIAALVPGIFISLLIFGLGLGTTGLWHYRSVSVTAAAM